MPVTCTGPVHPMEPPGGLPTRSAVSSRSNTRADELGKNLPGAFQRSCPLRLQGSLRPSGLADDLRGLVLPMIRSPLPNVLPTVSARSHGTLVGLGVTVEACRRSVPWALESDFRLRPLPCFLLPRREGLVPPPPRWSPLLSAPRTDSRGAENGVYEMGAVASAKDEVGSLSVLGQAPANDNTWCSGTTYTDKIAHRDRREERNHCAVSTGPI